MNKLKFQLEDKKGLTSETIEEALVELKGLQDTAKTEQGNDKTELETKINDDIEAAKTEIGTETDTKIETAKTEISTETDTKINDAKTELTEMIDTVKRDTSDIAVYTNGKEVESGKLVYVVRDTNDLAYLAVATKKFTATDFDTDLSNGNIVRVGIPNEIFESIPGRDIFIQGSGLAESYLQLVYNNEDIGSRIHMVDPDMGGHAECTIPGSSFTVEQAKSGNLKAVVSPAPSVFNSEFEIIITEEMAGGCTLTIDGSGNILNMS